MLVCLFVIPSEATLLRSRVYLFLFVLCFLRYAPCTDFVRLVGMTKRGYLRYATRSLRYDKSEFFEIRSTSLALETLAGSLFRRATRSLRYDKGASFAPYGMTKGRYGMTRGVRRWWVERATGKGFLPFLSRLRAIPFLLNLRL